MCRQSHQRSFEIKKYGQSDCSFNLLPEFRKKLLRVVIKR